MCTYVAQKEMFDFTSKHQWDFVIRYYVICKPHNAGCQIHCRGDRTMQCLLSENCDESRITKKWILLFFHTYHHHMAADEFAGYCGQGRADVGCSGFMALYNAQLLNF